MEKIACIVVDDEMHAIELLADHIAQIPELQLVAAFTDPEKAIAAIQAGGIDLTFVDVKMPGMSGIDLIRATHGKTKAILCTAFRRYAIEGYENDVVDYLLKPVTYDRFVKSVAKAKALLMSERIVEENDFLLIPGETRNSRLKIPYDDIELLEAMGNYTTIYTPKNKYLTPERLKQLAEQLPTKLFIRIHHSYIVPVKKIIKISGIEVYLSGNKSPIPVGGAYKQNLETLLRK
jgi:two-component system, LytTR family, response regulator